MRPRFVFNTLQRNGAIGLILVMVAFGIYTHYLKTHQQSKPSFFVDTKEALLVREFMDSVQKSDSVSSTKRRIFPFNPNFITDYKAYTLGMSTAEFDRLKKFRDQDQWINSKAEFQAVTKISDSLLNEISPLFKFPEWVIAQNERKNKIKSNVPAILSKSEKLDLNEASQEDLQTIKGIGEVLSKRIVLYRTQIGGFIDDLQLKDIYGLKYETRMSLTEKFTVQTPNQFEKLDLNKAEIVDLMEVPYIKYELARKIVNYRITREGINSFEELAEVQGFPFDRIDRLKLYLKIETIE